MPSTGPHRIFNWKQAKSGTANTFGGAETFRPQYAIQASQPLGMTGLDHTTFCGADTVELNFVSPTDLTAHWSVANSGRPLTPMPTII